MHSSFLWDDLLLYFIFWHCLVLYADLLSMAFP